MSLKVYQGYSHNFMTNTVKVAAALSGADYEIVKITQEGKEEFKANKNKSGLLPYVEIEDQGLGETNTILRYIARQYPDGGLYGKSIFQSAKVDEVLDYAVTLTGSLFGVLQPLFGWKQVTSAQFKPAKEKFVGNLKHLEALLNGKDYFVGDSITIADIRIAAILTWPFKTIMDPGTAKQIPSLIAHFKRISANETFKSFFGTSHVAKRPIKIQFKKEEKKKAPKEEAKKAPKKKAEKPKDPLTLLPPTSMDLNEFKFWFINHKDRDAAWEEFLKDRLDREGWSFWELNYIKYKNEGQLLYKTNNLLNGFIQRAEHFGKYSFGVHMIYGEEPNLDIKGIWMWRGQEIPQQLKDHAQFEYYNTKKLDIDNETDRAYIKDMWTAKDGPMKDGTIIQNWCYQK